MSFVTATEEPEARAVPRPPPEEEKLDGIRLRNAIGAICAECLRREGSLHAAATRFLVELNSMLPGCMTLPQHVQVVRDAVAHAKSSRARDSDVAPEALDEVGRAAAAWMQGERYDVASRPPSDDIVIH